MIAIKEIAPKDTDLIVSVIHETTLVSYSSYYPQEAINYFISYHSKENISKDMENGTTVACLENGTIIATGMLCDSVIKRVFVLPKYQNLGIGTKIMDFLENKACWANLDFVYLHASLPAKHFYDRKGYTTLRFSSIDVANHLTLDFYYMAKMLKQISGTPRWNFDQLSFRVVKNEGPEAEVTTGTQFTFYQNDELVMGKYTGGQIAEGELFGFVENDCLCYRYEQTNLSGERNFGFSRNVIQKTDNGKIRLVDSWEWKSRQGKGHCILEQV